MEFTNESFQPAFFDRRSENLSEYIVDLRERGMTIDEIYEALQEKGYKISRYRVWKVVKEYERRKYYFELISKLRIPTAKLYVIDALPVGGGSLVLLLDVKECKVLLMTCLSDSSLRAITDVLTPYIYKLLQGVDEGEVVFAIARVKPLSSGAGGNNRLTKKIRAQGGEVVILDMERRAKKLRKEVVERLMRSKNSEEMTKIINETCKRIMDKLYNYVEELENGVVSKDSEFLGEKDSRGD